MHWLHSVCIYRVVPRTWTGDGSITRLTAEIQSRYWLRKTSVMKLKKIVTVMCYSELWDIQTGLWLTAVLACSSPNSFRRMCKARCFSHATHIPWQPLLCGLVLYLYRLSCCQGTEFMRIHASCAVGVMSGAALLRPCRVLDSRPWWEGLIDVYADTITQQEMGAASQWGWM